MHLLQSLEELEEFRKQNINKTIVSTNGCFDILHKGHVHYLQQSKELGDSLVVAINSDQSVKAQNKGDNRPINDQLSRAFVLSALKSVNAVYIFDEKTPENFISALKPNIHTKGGDWKLDDLPEKKITDAYGGRIQLIEYIKGFSTTETIEKAKHAT